MDRNPTKDRTRPTLGRSALATDRGPREASVHDAQAVQDRLLADRYRSLAASYDVAYRSYSDATLSRALSLLGDPLPHHVLDLACGTGLLGERILARSPAVTLTCVDMSEEMLSVARERLALAAGRANGSHVRLLVGRAEQLPLADRSVEAVVIANAFHLVADPMAALRECRRVLAPAGRLIIVDWCRDFLAMRGLAIGLAITQRLRRRIVGARAMAGMLERAGFRLRHAERFRARPLWGMMAFAAVPHTGASRGDAR